MEELVHISLDDDVDVVTVGVLMIVGLLAPYSVPFVIGAVSEGLGLDVQRAGMLGTVEILGLAVSAMYCARLVSRYPMRRVAVLAIVATVFAQLASALSNSFEGLLVFRTLVGISQGVLLALVNILIARSRAPDVLYGRVLCLASIGYTLMLISLPYALKFNEQEGLFLALAAMSMLGVIWANKLPTLSLHQLAQEKVDTYSVPVSAVVIFFAVVTLLYIVLGGVWAFAERVAVQINIDRSLVGVLLGMSTLAGAVGAWSAAYIADRGGRALPTFLGFTGAGLSVLIICLASSTALYSVGILAYGYIYMFGITFVLGIAAAMDSQGRLAAVCNGYLLIPYALGPAVFGYIGIANLVQVGWASLIICLVTAVLILSVIRSLEHSIRPIL
ncbi:MAG: MFS family permease [Halieaceae bacterium]|jgi:MFS family permease